MSKAAYPLNTWTGKGGTLRTGLLVTAWEVLPLGRIGRKRPRSQQAEAYGSPAAFDDPLKKTLPTLAWAAGWAVKPEDPMRNWSPELREREERRLAGLRPHVTKS